jgi:hypothetical protein
MCLAQGHMISLYIGIIRNSDLISIVTSTYLPENFSNLVLNLNLLLIFSRFDIDIKRRFGEEQFSGSGHFGS